MYEILEATLSAMEHKANEMDITGVAYVGILNDKNSIDWKTAIRVCGKVLQKNTTGGNDFNNIAVVSAKASEMMLSRKNSGHAGRPILQGELGWEGGLFTEVENGCFVAAFSGGTSDEDLEVSAYGISTLVK